MKPRNVNFCWGALAPAMYLWGPGATTATGKFLASRERESTFHIRFRTLGKSKNTQPIVRILESRIQPPYTCSHGFISADLAGLPRFERSSFSAAYPFVNVALEDSKLPLSVELEAFTPFIPLNAKDSGIPGAVIRYKVKNNSGEALEATVASSVANAVGFNGYDLFDNLLVKRPVKNQYLDQDQMKGLLYTSRSLRRMILQTAALL